MSKSASLRPIGRDEILQRLETIDDLSPEPASGPVGARRWKLRRAAVLRGFFVVPDLLPGTGPAATSQAPQGSSDPEQLAFVREDCERARTPAGGGWRLTDVVRRLTVDDLDHDPELLLDTLHDAASEPLDVARAMAEDYLRGRARPLAEQTLDQLAATRLVTRWLAGVEVALPTEAQVDAQVRRTTLLAPLRTVLDGPFLGREEQLGRLDDYLEGLHPPGFRPLVISGAGGMGKSTLIAAALLGLPDSPRDLTAAPFAYLTFDRADLSPTRPLDLVADMLRQFAVHLPDKSATLERVAVTVEGVQASISGAELDEMNRSRSGNVEVWSRWSRDVDALMWQVAQALGDVPARSLACVLDTFERAQRHGTAAIDRLWDVFTRAVGVAPLLNVVIAGRGGVDDRDVEPMPLTGLPDAAARALLAARLTGVRAPARLVDVVVERARGNPLTLRLAADLMRRERGTFGGPAGRLRFLKAFDEVEVQGILYGRVLAHIDVDEAQAIAIPALVLRRVTPDLVREVLAPAAGLGHVDEHRSGELFAKLATESSLVVEQGGELRHRADVRAEVLPILERQQRDLVEAVHHGAVAYYARRGTTADRTEELYHRLALGQSERTLERRWDAAAAEPLDSVIDELVPRMRVFLATRLGISVDDATLRQARDTEWAGQAVKEARELLNSGEIARALDVLEGRDPEPMVFDVAALRFEALARAGRRDDALALSGRAAAEADRRGDAAASLRFRVLAAQVAEDCGDFDRAFVMLSEARAMVRESQDVVQETALGVSMLRVLRRADRRGDPTEVDLRQEVVRLARTLTRRQRRSSPGLVRDLAAEIGPDAPEFVVEAAQFVGVDVASGEAQQHLADTGKTDVINVGLGILDKGPSTGEGPKTSHEQGEAIGRYLEDNMDDEGSTKAFSEYFQAEADAPSFDPE